MIKIAIRHAAQINACDETLRQGVNSNGKSEPTEGIGRSRLGRCDLRHTLGVDFGLACTTAEESRRQKSTRFPSLRKLDRGSHGLASRFSAIERRQSRGSGVWRFGGPRG
jgi:hypothetical protein